MLPNAALKPDYGKVVWLYVFNDFKKGALDNAATRIRIRFGGSSWPQLLLVDPSTMKVIGNTGRSVASWRGAVGRTRIGKILPDAGKRLAAAEKQATALQGKHTAKQAREGLDSKGIVVRMLALDSLSKSSPATVLARAEQLLSVPNDLFRYSVCQVITKAKGPVGPKVVAALERIVRKPENSRNPNVLRMRAVQALDRVGTVQSMRVIGPHASNGSYRNGLTRIAVEAVAGIASRNPKARSEAAAILVKGFPKPPEAGSRMMRLCVYLARSIHKRLSRLTGRKVAFPASYDAAARQRLIQAFSAKK